MDKNKRPRGRWVQTDPVHLRSKYQDQSQRFIGWVDSLVFEQSLVWRWVSFLENRYRAGRFLQLFALTFALSLVVFWDFDTPSRIRTGEVVESDIVSPISVTMIDEMATEEQRLEAERAVPPLFDYNQSAYNSFIENLHVAFYRMRDLASQVPWAKSPGLRDQQIRDFMSQKGVFEELIGRRISDLHFAWLAQNKFSRQVEQLLTNALISWADERIIDIPANVQIDEISGIFIREIGGRVGARREYKMMRADLRNLQDKFGFTLEGVRGADRLRDADRAEMLDLARDLVFANVTYNSKDTSDRRRLSRQSVLPVQVSIRKGQVILSSGSTVQPVHAKLVETIREQRAEKRQVLFAFIVALMGVVVLSAFYTYLRQFNIYLKRLTTRDLYVFAIVALGNVLLVRGFLFVGDAVLTNKFGVADSVVVFAAPFAMAAMIVGLLVKSIEVIWLFTFFMAMIFGLLAEANMGVFLMTAVSGVVAARGVFRCEKRNDIYIAGVKVGLMNAFVVACYVILVEVTRSDLLQYAAGHMIAGFVGGLLGSILTMAFIPVVESVFNYTTDIKLLELANLSHPVMQEMVVKAPGTYHHSLVVGSMCEAAAKEIGANALLAKVMAYYHDIGKMEHAQYFIENQRPNYNPHDHVSPYMSKTILVAHVKDGAEMAMHHKLGQPIVDGILQHHGTTLIPYFFNRAMEEAAAQGDTVDESDFRYPGPKPQFKEAGIVMLADSIEAAARSLDEPTTTRLQSIVKTIIQNKFTDGQLEDCNLTLRDLSFIEKSFNKILLGIYHHRIDYPGAATVTPSRRASAKWPKRAQDNEG